MKEEKLVMQLKKKKTSALERIIEIYTPYVSTVIKNTLKGYISNEDLEELVADSFMSLWEHADNISSQRLCGYLSAISRTRAYNYMCKNFVVTENIEDNIIISDDNVEEEAVQRELSDMLKDVLSRLPDTEREIMLRFYYYSQKVSEISDDMNMNLSTVKTKLSRSRKVLRKELEKRGYGYAENRLE